MLLLLYIHVISTGIYWTCLSGIIIIIIVRASYYLLLSDAQGALTYSIFLQVLWDYVWIMRPTLYSFYIAPCNGLQGAVAHQGEPLLDKWTGLFYVLYTTHRTKGMVKCLAFKVQGCHDWDSNPHSANQKHRSLSAVLLTARPRTRHRHAWTSSTTKERNAFIKASYAQPSQEGDYM